MNLCQLQAEKNCFTVSKLNWEQCYSLLFKSFFLFSSLQVATFILQKILLDELGLSYICQTYERFSHVAMILVSTQNKFFVLRTGKYWSSIWYLWCVSDNLPFIKYIFLCFDYALWKTIIFHSPVISNFIRGKWCYTCLKRCLPGYWNMLSGAIWGCLITQGQWWLLMRTIVVGIVNTLVSKTLL